MRMGSSGPSGRHGAAVVLGLAVVALLVLPSAGGPTFPGTAPARSPARFGPADENAAAGWVGISTAGAPAPPGRLAGGLAYSPVAGYSVLFGGCTRHLCPAGDTWKYESGNWTNLTATLSPAPAPRYGAVLVFDAADGSLILFGGQGSSAMLNDTWAFTGGTWTPLTAAGHAPSPRAFAQAAFDPGRDAVVLFGGRSPTGATLDDTWAFAGGVWTNLTGTSPESPPPRSAGGFAWDAPDGAAVLFGGAGANGAPRNDTWSFGATGWTNLTTAAGTAPAARTNTTLAFDAGRSALLLFGGEGVGTAFSDTWAFSAGRWTALTANLSASPGPRYGSMSTYDASDGYLLLFGGMLGGSRYATWALLSPLNVTISGSPATLAPGLPVTLTAEISGGLPPYTASWQFGDASPAVAGLVAAHTYAAAGTYLVVVSVDDATFATAGANLSLAVRYTPLNVTIHASAGPAVVGGSLTFSAVVSGGVAPYAFSWSAAAGLCTGRQGPVLSCTPTAPGSFEVGVTVTDASGLSAASGLSVVIGTSPGSGSATRSSPAPSSIGGSAGAWVVLVPLAVALAGGAAVLVLVLLAGRRRRARAQERPLCYAVPAWSETPPEYHPVPSQGSAVEAWSRTEPPGGPSP